ncbi:hypothetical protein ABZ250_39875 [Streptomyces afghaniensis]|uniref:hypothetical protein n=1 Tax=Streptomyces afghaniensis TaxID=66865 RepID=UPI0033AA3905
MNSRYSSASSVPTGVRRQAGQRGAGAVQFGGAAGDGGGDLASVVGSRGYEAVVHADHGAHVGGPQTLFGLFPHLRHLVDRSRDGELVGPPS